MFGLSSVKDYVSQHVVRPLEDRMGLASKAEVADAAKQAQALVTENTALKNRLADQYVAAGDRPSLAKSQYAQPNPVKAALNANRPVWGAFVASSDNMFTELAASKGVDYVFVDGEHGVNSLEQLRSHFMAAQLHGAVPIVRVPINEIDAIKPILDAGPGGVIVSNIETPEDVKKAIAAVYFKSERIPEGDRRVGLGRAANYSFDLDKVNQSNDHVALILMAERGGMLKNLDGIMEAAKGKVDAFTIGPQDMAASMGLLGQPGHPDVKAAFAKIAEAAQKVGIPMGASVPDRATANKLMEQGYRFFTGPSDLESFGNKVKDWMAPAEPKPAA
jgi:4-hydroxy-2-oxoheptanedioate aldolase